MIAPRTRGGRWVIVPDTRQAAMARAATRRVRRRKIQSLASLLLLALASGIWALENGGIALGVHLAMNAVTLSYAASLYESRRRRRDRLRKVRAMQRPVPRRRWSELDEEPIAL